MVGRLLRRTWISSGHHKYLSVKVVILTTKSLNFSTLLIRMIRASAALVLSVVALAQTSDSFFDDSIVQEIRLYVHPSDWRALRDNYLQDTYYEADFVSKGAEVGHVGIRSRGAGSRSPH